jgi:hypothetical protein
LKQHITEFEAENTELRKKNTKILYLKNKLSISDAEIAKLKHRNIKFLKVNEEYNERRDVNIKKLKQKNTELEARLVIVKQDSLAVNKQSSEVSAVDDSVVQLKHPKTYSKINGIISEINTKANVSANSKSSEKSEINKFLDEIQKKC